MANLSQFRTAKSASSWCSSQLQAFNIDVVAQDEQAFFGHPLPAYTGPHGFIQNERWFQGLDGPSLALMKRLYLATKLTKGEESAVDDFTAELLRVVGYETDSTVIRTRKNIRLFMCGEEVSADTDICLLDANAAFNILLVIQEDKNHITPQYCPQAQLVAEAIAAFQVNNRNRHMFLQLGPLEEMVIPGITLIGTFPQFYKIKVTANLEYCIRHAFWPDVKTTVYRHTPRVNPDVGMKSLHGREHILCCYEAFKQYVLSAH